MSAPGENRAGVVFVDSGMTEPFLDVELSVHLTERRFRRVTECCEHPATLVDIERPFMKRSHRIGIGEGGEVVSHGGIFGDAYRLEQDGGD